MNNKIEQLVEKHKKIKTNVRKSDVNITFGHARASNTRKSINDQVKDYI